MSIKKNNFVKMADGDTMRIWQTIEQSISITTLLVRLSDSPKFFLSAVCFTCSHNFDETCEEFTKTALSSMNLMILEKNSKKTQRLCVGYSLSVMVNDIRTF